MPRVKNRGRTWTSTSTELQLTSACSRQSRVKMVLTLFNNDVPLRIRRTLSLYKVHGDSTLLVLNRTSLNSLNTLLALSRNMFVAPGFRTNNCKTSLKSSTFSGNRWNLSGHPWGNCSTAPQVYGSSALLVLNGTSLNSVNALLALRWQSVLLLAHSTNNCKTTLKNSTYFLGIPEISPWGNCSTAPQVYGSSALLVLNGTSLNSVNALLALRWQSVLLLAHSTNNCKTTLKNSTYFLGIPEISPWGNCSTAPQVYGSSALLVPNGTSLNSVNALLALRWQSVLLLAHSTNNCKTTLKSSTFSENPWNLLGHPCGNCSTAPQVYGGSALLVLNQSNEQH